MAGRKAGSRVTISGLDEFLEMKLTKAEDVKEVSIKELFDFPNHPFRVVDDEEMEELAASVKQNGVLNPALVRKRKGGGYEIISGHRRKRALELAGKDMMPVTVLEVSDEEAISYMIDSNIQRENVLPSEKAKAYRMKYDAMKHPGTRRGGWALKSMEEAEGVNMKTIQRYIALSNLTEALLAMVDERQLGFMQGVELSYLTKEEQKLLEKQLSHKKYKVTKEKARMIRNLSKENRLSEETLDELFVDSGRMKTETIRIRNIRRFFPSEYTDTQIEAELVRILEEWKSRK